VLNAPFGVRRAEVSPGGALLGVTVASPTDLWGGGAALVEPALDVASRSAPALGVTRDAAAGVAVVGVAALVGATLVR
jgi:hypothetical protein